MKYPNNSLTGVTRGSGDKSNTKIRPFNPVIGSNFKELTHKVRMASYDVIIMAFRILANNLIMGNNFMKSTCMEIYFYGR